MNYGNKSNARHLKNIEKMLRIFKRRLSHLVVETQKALVEQVRFMVSDSTLTREMGEETEKIPVDFDKQYEW